MRHMADVERPIGRLIHERALAADVRHRLAARHVHVEAPHADGTRLRVEVVHGNHVDVAVVDCEWAEGVAEIPDPLAVS